MDRSKCGTGSNSYWHIASQNVTFWTRTDIVLVQLFNHSQCSTPALALGARRHVLPAQQEADEVLGGHGLDLAPQAGERVAVNPGQQAAITELFARERGVDIPLLD